MLLDTFPYIPLPGRAGCLMLSSESNAGLGRAAAQYLKQLTPPWPCCEQAQEPT